MLTAPDLRPDFASPAPQGAAPAGAPFLPTSRAEMHALGWEQCDVIIVTADPHAEARMIHVGIAGHDDDIALLPAERVHFGARGRQKRRAGGCGALRGRRGKVGA